MEPLSNVSLPVPLAPWAATGGIDYVRDAMERSVLVLDTLRRRGNADLAHAEAGAPELLKFEHELVLDGRDLPRPCNYALLRITPPDGVRVDPHARPVVVVDPRAGHGPGIGGFKVDSEVGVALRAGHPVYFVSFRPQPEEGQTLLDVATAEAQFLAEVAARHAGARGKPLVIGNCQAGWAMAGLAAVRPELFGTLILVGAPLSYWAGSSRLNPMRYSGAALGGAWLAAMTADLGADRFDGAHLVSNFEKLNPANTHWSRHFKLWSQVDTEAERYLDFERWWGGYFRMSGEEIESIVENLFVGNRLARGEVQLGSHRVDLRNISSPVVVFASWGDNITPPPQALNWIIDVWGDERAIAAAGRTIVYVLHETVGHLGIFVGADIARKEHQQIVTSLDVIDDLPPGLYEMKLSTKDGDRSAPWDALEPGAYHAQFEPRTMQHLRAINPEGREEEKLFSTVAKHSEINTALYKTWMRPWLRPMATRMLADAATHLHPLRSQRHALSDASPGSAAIAGLAEGIRANRHPVSEDHPGHQAERAFSGWIELTLNLFRDLRDQAVVNTTRVAFGPAGVGAWLRPDPADEDIAAARAQAELDATRIEVLARIGEGDFDRAVCRIVLAAMASNGRFERRSLRLARRLAEGPAAAEGVRQRSTLGWRDLVRDEAMVRAVAPVEALEALVRLLPTAIARERALAVAAAVLVAEPTAEDNGAEFLGGLVELLGADPRHVMKLGFELTHAIELSSKPARKSARPLKTAPKRSKK
jgi:hypothetical protein